MTRKSKPKWDNPEESKRFLETAKAVEASDDPKDLEKALKRVAPVRRGQSKAYGR
jgi:hypothetical protein